MRPVSRPQLAVPWRGIGARSRVHRKLTVTLLALIALAIYCIAAPPWVIESLAPAGSGSSKAGSASLNPEKYVAAIWSSKVLATVKRTAVDLPTLLAAIKANSDAASKRYGHTAELGGPASFLVKASGTVLSVDTSSIPSTATVAVSGGGGKVSIQLGPIVTGTDVRDALPFINFNQFVNQVSFGEVATALNTKIVKTELSKIDSSKLKGRRVSFDGAFTLTSGSAPLITPITIEVAG